MTSFDTYYVNEDDAQRVEATLLDLWGSLPYWADPALADTPVVTDGPLMRLVAALQSMRERSDGHTTLWVGQSYSRPVKGNEFPLSGAPLFGGEGRRSHMAVTWESAGGLWSDRAWRLDATLHIEVDLTYGDTYVSLTGVHLRVTGRTAGGTVFIGDDGLANLLVHPLRAAIARRAFRDLGEIEVESGGELSDMDDHEWFTAMDQQRPVWMHGFGVEGEKAPRTWLNASPYDVILSDGTELEASGSPAWIAGRGGDCPEPADLPDPVPGQAVIVTEAIALLSPHRRDLVYPAPAGPVLIDNRGGRIPVKEITRH